MVGQDELWWAEPGKFYSCTAGESRPKSIPCEAVEAWRGIRKSSPEPVQPAGRAASYIVAIGATGFAERNSPDGVSETVQENVPSLLASCPPGSDGRRENGPVSGPPVVRPSNSRQPTFRES